MTKLKKEQMHSGLHNFALERELGDSRQQLQTKGTKEREWAQLASQVTYQHGGPVSHHDAPHHEHLSHQ
jgi:hypothetical protein